MVSSYQLKSENLGSKGIVLLKKYVFISLFHQIVPGCCRVTDFIYDVNMLLLRQQNVYFKENLQFITTSNLFLCLCLSVHYEDMPMVRDEELNLALRS